jgi:hypothetical protein
MQNHFMETLELVLCQIQIHVGATRPIQFVGNEYIHMFGQINKRSGPIINLGLRGDVKGG